MLKNKVVFNGQTLIDLTEDTVTEDTLCVGITAHKNDGSIITGIYEPVFETPIINVSNTGLITVSANDKSATQQLSTQAAKTVTPTKSTQTAVSSGKYTTGAVTVAPIPSEYIITTDATATSNDIVTGKSGYVNGVKVNGSLVVQTYYTGSSEPASSLGNDGDLYLKV